MLGFQCLRRWLRARPAELVDGRRIAPFASSRLLASNQRHRLPEAARAFIGLEPLEPRLLLSASPLGIEPFADEPDAPLAPAALTAGASAESEHLATEVQAPIVEASESSSSPFLDVTLDYTYDTNNFFDTPAKRDLLELAFETVAGGFTDALAAIEPEGDDTWTASFPHPGTGETQQIDDLVVGERELIIFAGGRDLGPLAQGGPGGFSASGSGAWLETVRGRGQEGALDEPATNFGPWGGMVTFDTEADWYFGEDTDGLTVSEYDFLSVAIHEVIHVLGFTYHVDAYANLVDEDNLVFTGERATALYEGDGHPPLAAANDLSHWEAGFTHDGEVSVMTPTISRGERQAVTDIDIATLQDIGWTSLANLVADDVHTDGLGEHQFTVIYDSGTDLDVGTLIDNDQAIRVTGPDGFDALASYVDIDEPSDGPVREVTYAITGPDGQWDADDEGTYAVKLEPEQVADVHGTHVPAGTLGTFGVQIDTTAPTTSIQLAGTAGNGPWFRSPVEITLEASDDLSGVDTIKYHFGDEQWQTYDEPFTFSDDGITPIHYRATDHAGNVEETRTGNVYIDTLAPTTTHELAGEEGESGWFTGDVTLALEATDDVSGVNLVEYHLGDENWQLYDTASPLEFTDDGITNVHYRATDEAGNTEDTQTVDVKIDTVAPTSAANLAGEEGNDPWFISPVDVTLTGKDDTSGVERLEYHLGDENWQVFDTDAGLSLTGNGTMTLHHRAVDVAGHIEDAQSVEVRIDTVAPTAQAVVDDIVAEPDDEPVTPEIVVEFSDNIALELSSIVGNDEAIRVTGPDGFDALATYVDDEDSADDLTREVTYRLDAIGESWHDAHSGTYVVHLEDGQVMDAAGNAAEAGEIGAFHVSVPGQVANVLARHVFYNNSSFDGGDAGPGAHNDAALAPDKHALLPGEMSSAANYTSYSRGLNGIMIDIAALAEAGNLSEGDLEFVVGNDSSPDSWEPAPEPIHIHVRPGDGVDGSDRIEVIWTDNAIVNTWLEVTVRANDVTGLEDADVFYFGNAIGRTGDGGGVADIRENQTGFGSAEIDNVYDVNRDGRVSLSDVILARIHQAEAQSLASISVPAPPTEASPAVVEAQQPTPAETAAFSVGNATAASNEEDRAAPIDALASLEPLNTSPSLERAQGGSRSDGFGLAAFGNGEPFGLRTHHDALRGAWWDTGASDDDDDDENPWWSANIDVAEVTLRLL